MDKSLSKTNLLKNLLPENHVIYILYGNIPHKVITIYEETKKDDHYEQVRIGYDDCLGFYVLHIYEINDNTDGDPDIGCQVIARGH